LEKNVDPGKSKFLNENRKKKEWIDGENEVMMDNRKNAEN
jgi:hypothetical protein